MGSFSLTQWLVVLAVVLIVLGAGRLPKTMGELARGLRAFRTGMRDDAATAGEQPVEAPPAERTGDRALS
jgi:sec-independent protein translocase protein TatA